MKLYKVNHFIFWGIEEIECVRETKKFYILENSTRVVKGYHKEYTVLKNKEQALERYQAIVKSHLKNHTSEIKFYERLLLEFESGDFQISQQGEAARL